MDFGGYVAKTVIMHIMSKVLGIIYRTIFPSILNKIKDGYGLRKSRSGLYFRVFSVNRDIRRCRDDFYI
jgi:hypothetical protein